MKRIEAKRGVTKYKDRKREWIHEGSAERERWTDEIAEKV